MSNSRWTQHGKKKKKKHSHSQSQPQLGQRQQVEFELQCVAAGVRPACLPARVPAEVQAPLRTVQAAGCAFVVCTSVAPADIPRPVFVDVSGDTPVVVADADDHKDVLGHVHSWADVAAVAAPPQRVGPALAGWLLGYPVAYVLCDGDEHCLSRHALVVVTVRTQTTRLTIMQFTFPHSLREAVGAHVQDRLRCLTEQWPPRLRDEHGPLEVVQRVQEAGHVVL